MLFQGNKIYLEDEKGNKKRIFHIKGLKIRFKGKNSIITIKKPCIKFKKSKIVCGDNAKIIIESSKKVADKLTILANGTNSICKIGKNFSCTNGCLILLHREANLNAIIGEDCMFGTNVVLRCSDAHAIYDINTNKIINNGGNIIINDHCWLGMNTTVLKQVSIAPNTIIATGSIVTKNCETSNAIYAGIPAKIVKHNINWNRESPKK